MSTCQDMLLGWRYRSHQGHQVVDWAAPVYDDGLGNLSTVAVTGAGKGVSYVVPALLSWPGSVIVIDVKGELAAVTASRRRALGQRVEILDPFGMVKTRRRAALNPLDLLDPDSPHFGSDARAFATRAVGDPYLLKDPFWNERAITLVAGVAQALVEERGGGRVTSELVADVVDSARSLRGSFGLSTKEKSEDDAFFEFMCNSRHRGARAAAHIVLGNESRVFSSIQSVGASGMSYAEDGLVGRALGHSTIKLADIQCGKPTTIFIVVPPDKLISHGKLLKMWVGLLLSALARRQELPEHDTLFVIDEAAQLGRMQELLAAITLLRGYGVRVWSFWQDVSQMRGLYPLEWETILNNCRTQLWFGVTNPRMAAQFSEAIGAFTKEELSAMDLADAVLLQGGRKPEIIRRPNYLRDAQFKGLYDPHPLYGVNARPSPVKEQESPGNVISLPLHSLN